MKNLTFAALIRNERTNIHTLESTEATKNFSPVRLIFLYKVLCDQIISLLSRFHFWTYISKYLMNVMKQPAACYFVFIRDDQHP